MCPSLDELGISIYALKVSADYMETDRPEKLNPNALQKSRSTTAGCVQSAVLFSNLATTRTYIPPLLFIYTLDFFIVSLNQI